MKHNIKLPDGTIKAVDCKLGSGITDKNGREIFEGDRVKVDLEEIRQHTESGFEEFEFNPPADNVTEAVYQYGEFVLMWDVNNRATWISLVEFDLFKGRSSYLEVIGHVEDAK